MLLLAILAPRADAFCGTYVGTAGSDLFASATEVALVREDGHTTLTMANDYEGDLSQFAVVVPVPVILGEEDVHVLDPEVIDRLEIYSGPRLVSYTCDELYPDPPPRSSAFEGGCSGGGCADQALFYTAEDQAGAWDSGYGGTNVEAEFIVGEYEIVVLSAEESTGMLRWLEDQGYAVSADAADMIQEYLDGGSYFFAAKVDLDLVPASQDKLSPLQFGYDSDVFSLPIRLGTVNSRGSQDLVIYAITTPEDGRVGISNYDEATMESGCMLEQDAFAETYGQQFADAVAGEDAHWVAEYGWKVDAQSIACDPCPEGVPPDTPIPVADMATLGYNAAEGVDTGWGHYNLPGYYFTRLHMRYSPEQATEDLTLYTSGITENTQQRYIIREDYLEVEFPVCGEGWVQDDPGSCADVDRKFARRIRAANREANGCHQVPLDRRAGFALLAGLGLIFVRVRRRSP